MQPDASTPEMYYFTDDGLMPNSPLPVVIYRQVISLRGEEAAKWMEETFLRNAWSNSWRNGIYSYHHFHSNTHEVLGIYSGQVLTQMGGINGEKIPLRAGDLIIIPAGVGHKNIESKNLGVVGAYPQGLEPDLLKPSKSNHTAVKLAVSRVTKPRMDPLLGVTGGINESW